jgi:hypothetical protein
MPDSSNYSARRARVRYTLTVPTHANNGASLVRIQAEVRARLLRYFGAYTSCAASGVWRAADTGREHVDTSIVYTVDVSTCSRPTRSFTRSPCTCARLRGRSAST